MKRGDRVRSFVSYIFSLWNIARGYVIVVIRMFLRALSPTHAAIENSNMITFLPGYLLSFNTLYMCLS